MTIRSFPLHHFFSHFWNAYVHHAHTHSMISILWGAKMQQIANSISWTESRKYRIFITVHVLCSMDAIWDQSSHFIVGNFEIEFCMRSKANDWTSGCNVKPDPILMQWKVFDALLRVWACMRLMNFVWRFCFLFFSFSHLFLPKILILQCNELDFHFEFVCFFDGRWMHLLQ